MIFTFSTCYSINHSDEKSAKCFMTPADFLEAVTEAAPRKSAYKKSFSRDDVLKRLRDTTPITPNSDIKNDTEFFRKLGQNGIISFNEYLFLLCIITKPRQGFEVAFKMFDTGKDLSHCIV